MNKIKYCKKCKKYTLEDKCLKCGAGTIKVKPPRYSTKEKIAEYRRKTKKELLKKEGLL